ncbi:BamA/TamA family outer membrane protein [Hahella ganghwensis]|uniref:BamA/TamA family outer membrane protein n=1 Tax=Hahella ganghwensis TaxID=286420 RepID=UPI000366D56A|nr:BamA/TamA family outer membrane protein [Hahella ganghwensis]
MKRHQVCQLCIYLFKPLPLFKQVGQFKLSLKFIPCLMFMYAALLSSSATGEVSAGESFSQVDEGCTAIRANPADLDLDDLEGRVAELLQVPDGAVIRSIRIYPQDIYHDYGKEENLRWYEHTVNALHPITIESAIESQLLFEKGDEYSKDLIEETERNLRRSPYLYNAQIVPTQVCGNLVDLAVVTRDLWTLLPTIGLSRSGGDNRTIIGLSDKNFFGTGKEVSFNREAEKDRVEYNVDYFDPNLFGSRWQAGFQLADSSDGERQSGSVIHPFYRAGAPWAFELSGFHEIRSDELYFRDETINEFRHLVDKLNISVGVSTFFDGSQEQRLFLGASAETHEFSEIPETMGPIPEDRQLRYPWIAYEWQDNEYLKAFNISQIKQVEDIPLGWRHYVKFGWSDEELGASSDQIVFGFESRHRYGDAYRIGSLAVSQEGYWNVDNGTSENLVLTLAGDFTQLNEERDRAWFTSIIYKYVHNLTLDNQLLLGGNNGLRGYPSNYQAGTQSFLFSAERRFFWEWYPLKTFHVAGVVFFDAGRAWFPGQGNGINGKVLTDVGFGIRVTSSRIRVTRVVHVDLAFPLDREDDGIEEVQLVLRGQQSF